MPLQDCVSEKIRKIMHDKPGIEQDQAIAIAYSMCSGRAYETLDEEQVKRIVTDYTQGALKTALPFEAEDLDDLQVHNHYDPGALRIKALTDDGRIGGYLVAWGSSQQRDVQREYFTRGYSDLALDWYDRRPILFHHGLDKKVRAKRIGDLDTLREDDIGLWAEGQLDLRNRYVQAIQKLIDRGIFNWSSGSLRHLAYDEDGHIKFWPIVEGSLTASPAEPRWTGVRNLKAIKSMFEDISLEELAAKAGVVIEDEPDGEAADPQKAQPIIDSKQEESDVNVQEIIARVLQAVMQRAGVQLSEEQQAGIMQDVLGSAQQGENGATMALDKPVTDEEEIKRLSAKFVPLVAEQVQKYEADRTRKLSLVQAAADEALKGIIGAGGESRVPGMGQHPATKSAPARITDVRDVRFDHLQAPDMALGFMILRSLKRDVGEDYLKAMAYKTAQRIERNDVNASDLAVKSLFPFDKASDVFGAQFAALKANEVMGVGQAGFGQEYAVTYYSTEVWQIVRQETKVYDRMRALGMSEDEVPDGYKSDTVPLEGADMDWFNAGAGATDIAAGARHATPTTATAKFATGQKEVTLGRLTARTYWQMELEQDSIVGIVQEANRKIKVSAKEQIEKVFLNGDTETGANANINLIDGTPAAPPNKPSYTLFDGILKLPLVTNTANRYDALNTLSEKVYLSLLPLLGTLGKHAGDPDKILFIIDNPTYFASLNLAVLKTQDVFPTATIVEGVLRRIWGVEVLRSAQMVLANSVGKIPAAGGSLGRIGLVRPDQWAAKWKRKLEIFTEFDKDSYVTELAAHMRFGAGFRDNEASACTVNVNVTIV